MLSPLGTPENGLYGDSPPKRGTSFRLELYKTGKVERAVEQGRAELTSDLQVKWGVGVEWGGGG